MHIKIIIHTHLVKTNENTCLADSISLSFSLRLTGLIIDNPAANIKNIASGIPGKLYSNWLANGNNA